MRQDHTNSCYLVLRAAIRDSALARCEFWKFVFVFAELLSKGKSVFPKLCVNTEDAHKAGEEFER